MGEVSKLGKYEIQATLGQGAMGVVYQAFDPHIKRTVALKTIRKDALSAQEMAPLLTRFKQEAQAVGRLAHPGVVTVFEYGEDAGIVFIAMEFVQGRELKEILNNNERLSLATTVNLITQLLEALAYSHEQGVVHRDIKPGNILLLKDGRIKVTDFGIAKIESSDLTQCGDFFGTPSCMSPEQFTGQPVDRRSDLFSVGVILYQLLTGEKPFPGNSLASIMHRVLNTAPPKVSELSPRLSAEFDQLVDKAMAKKPEERFQTAVEFAAALKSAYRNLNDDDAESDGEAMRMNSVARNEATIFEPVAAATQIIPPSRTDLEDNKTTGATAAPRSRVQVSGPPSSQRDRRLLLSGLVLFVLTLGFSLAWIFFSGKPKQEPPPILTEKPADLGSPQVAVTGEKEAAPTPAATAIRPSGNKVHHKTVPAPPPDSHAPIKEKDGAIPAKDVESAPAKKEPVTTGSGLSGLTWPPDQSWTSRK